MAHETASAPAAHETLLAGASVAALTNALFRRGLRNQYLPGIGPVAAGLPNMVGPAFTLRFIPAREDIDTLAAFAAADNLQRRAFEECPAGAVLVIDAGSERRAACAGDLLVSRLQVRGCAGVVTDGGFRDVAGIRALGFPAYQAQAVAGASPIALHPADLERPIRCAGVAIYPGDILVGDSEGVIAIPPHMAEEVAREASEAAAYQRFAEGEIARGASLFDIFPPTPAALEAFATRAQMAGPAASPADRDG